MKILLIDNYDSFSFNLAQAVRAIVEVPEEKERRAPSSCRATVAYAEAPTTASVVVRRNDQITLEEIIALRPHGIIISPGPGHPANPDDFGVNQHVLANSALLQCPILGVCLGHQGIAHAFGGTVERAAKIMHGKTSRIRQVAVSPLFLGVPSEFVAMRYHSLAATDETLPSCLKVTARDTETNSIMALEHRDKPIFGLQFHPESIGTPEGPTVLKNFVSLCAATGGRHDAAN